MHIEAVLSMSTELEATISFFDLQQQSAVKISMYAAKVDSIEGGAGFWGEVAVSVYPGTGVSGFQGLQELTEGDFLYWGAGVFGC